MDAFIIILWTMQTLTAISTAHMHGDTEERIDFVLNSIQKYQTKGSDEHWMQHIKIHSREMNRFSNKRVFRYFRKRIDDIRCFEHFYTQENNSDLVRQKITNILFGKIFENNPKITKFIDG